ncbi:MAG: hypothetical protein ACJ8CB_28520 [Ktedonobacteraceae bacterium]
MLGPPEVVHEGSRLTFALRKAEALLLYLALGGCDRCLAGLRHLPGLAGRGAAVGV